MAIDAFVPPIQQVIVQTGFLERAFQDFLEPELGYDKLCNIEPVPSRIGETITLTRPALLPPITLDATPIAAGSDINQGMTPQTAGYEQFPITVSKLKGMMNLSLEMDYTKIASEYMLNWRRLAIQAAQSLDIRAATRIFNAYLGGNTYATTAATSQTTIHVDNVNGFQTQYNTTSGYSPGVPAAVGAGNKLPVLIYSAASPNNPPTSVNVTGFTIDGSNTSSAGSYGASGTLTLDAAVTVAVGDIVKSVDGAVVIRPNSKLAFAGPQGLASTDTITLDQFGKAAAKLRNRRVNPLPNGLYAAMVDAEMLSDLMLDQSFRQATTGQFDKMPFFKSGIVAGMLGLEFVPTTTNPVFQGVASGVVARHAVVIGSDAIIKSPFEGSEQAARDSAGGLGVSDIRVTRSGVQMITRPAIDVEGDTVTQVWRFTGGHACPTDVTSTPAIIPSTDYARYKRAIVIESASAA